MRVWMLALLFFPSGVAADTRDVTVDLISGSNIYDVFCETCHGDNGEGNGPFAEILSVEPANLTRLAVENGGEFPRFRVIRQIDGRDPLLGHGGEMPVFGPVFEGEPAALNSALGQPILTSRSIADLVAWLESIQVQ